MIIEDNVLIIFYVIFFFTYSMRLIKMLSIKYIDTCLPDYLTDHHNRDNEQLIALIDDNYSNAKLIEAVMEELDYYDSNIWDQFSEEDVKQCVFNSNMSLNEVFEDAEYECMYHYLLLEW